MSLSLERIEKNTVKIKMEQSFPLRIFCSECENQLEIEIVYSNCDIARVLVKPCKKCNKTEKNEIID